MSSISASRRMPARRRSLLLLLAALAIIAAVWSWLMFVVPKPQTLDQHVESVAGQLRCPICQGESVADSPTGIALQMRQVIRTQILEGKSDQQIVQYFVSRYGAQNIIWTPPWQGFTLLIWIVPIVLFVGGLLLLFIVARDWQFSAALSRLSNRRASTVDNAADTATEEQSCDKPAASSEDASLEPYRALLEQELAADDILFKRFKTEAK